MPFNHFDDDGHAHMVDVSGKEPSLRRAMATATVELGTELLQQVLDRKLVKGDVLGVARLSGIAAVKRTPDLIPLAHPVAVHHAAIDFDCDEAAGCVTVRCDVCAHDRTGLEMEAMTGAGVAALTIYDMCKGTARGIRITDLQLVHKSGGRSGTWERGAT